MSVPKRLIAVLNWRGGAMVKSYGYSIWRPAMRLAASLRVLDRWQLDEIVLLDISRGESTDEVLLGSLAGLDLTTPLAVGGGIRGREDVERVLESGADRIVLESVLFDQPDAARSIVDMVGRQAIIGSMPVTASCEEISVWRPVGNVSQPPLEVARRWFDDGLVGEVMVTDVEAEGYSGRFSPNLPHIFAELLPNSVIWFGGLGAAEGAQILRLPITAGVAFGNPLHHSELAAVSLRSALKRGDTSLLRRWSPA